MPQARAYKLDQSELDYGELAYHELEHGELSYSELEHGELGVRARYGKLALSSSTVSSGMVSSPRARVLGLIFMWASLLLTCPASNSFPKYALYRAHRLHCG